MNYIVTEDFKTSAKRFKDQGGTPEEVDAYIRDFKQLKPKIQDVDKKDIDKWKSWDEFKVYVDELKQTKSKGQEKKEKKKAGAKLVASDKYWDVYKITTHEAAQLYGSGTKWCITQADCHYWDEYSDSVFYFYISKRLRPSSPFYKIALQVHPDGVLEYWDATDRNHGRDEDRFWHRSRTGTIPFKLPDIPEVEEKLEKQREEQEQADLEAERKAEDERPSHTLYLKTGSVLDANVLSRLEREFGEDMVTSLPRPGVPTHADEYINVNTSDEDIVKKVVEIVGRENIQEIAPELTT